MLVSNAPAAFIDVLVETCTEIRARCVDWLKTNDSAYHSCLH